MITPNATISIDLNLTLDLNEIPNSDAQVKLDLVRKFLDDFRSIDIKPPTGKGPVGSVIPGKGGPAVTTRESKKQ